MIPDLKTLIEAVAATISAHAEELTALDSAIRGIFLKLH